MLLRYNERGGWAWTRYQQMFGGVKQVADGLIMANEGVKKIAEGAIAARQERNGLHDEIAELRDTVQQLQVLVLQQTQEIRQLREQIGDKSQSSIGHEASVRPHRRSP